MSTKLAPQLGCRYNQLDLTLSHTAQVIKHAKQLLQKEQNPQFSIHRRFRHTPSLNIDFSCRVSFEDRQQLSNRSLANRSEVLGKGQGVSDRSGEMSERVLRPTFSFGRLEAVVEEQAEGKVQEQREGEQEEGSILESKVIRVGHISGMNQSAKQQSRASSSVIVTSSFRRIQELLGESIRLPSSSQARIQPQQNIYETPPKRSIKQDVKILIEEEQTQPPTNYSTSFKASEKKYERQFQQRVQTEPVRSASPYAKKPRKLQGSDLQLLEQRFQTLRGKFKQGLSNSAYLRKNGYLSDQTRPQTSPCSTSRSLISRPSDTASNLLKRKLLTYQSQLAYQPLSRSSSPHSFHIDCPKYRKEVQRDMRSRFLNEFGFLYTEKRVSYEELFEMYKSCRRRNVPEYRWKQEVLGRMAGRMGEGHTM